MDSNQQQDKPQDFELVELLFRNQSTTDKFESFKERFQSFIDQIPSYLHSSIKDGFFSHFFFGIFSTLLNTELAGRIGIKSLHFLFDGAKTLKVVAETGEDVHIFIFTEEEKEIGIDRVIKRRFNFTQGELNSINLTNEELKLREPKIKIIEIKKQELLVLKDSV